MNSIERGKLISQLRIEAGYTQKSLAEALFVSDKAVSKWERGVCMPDSSLLTKLSMLLDTDIEYLISGKQPYGENKYYGEINCDNINYTIAGKPLIYYLLSYFMLAGIKDINITTKDSGCIRNFDFGQFGIHVSINSPRSNVRSIFIFDSFFLFGANLTRYFHSFLSSENEIIPVLNGFELPMFITNNPQLSIKWHRAKAERKTMARGITYIQLNSEEARSDASKFIEIYEKYNNRQIADLFEIAQNRGFV